MSVLVVDYLTLIFKFIRFVVSTSKRAEPVAADVIELENSNTPFP